MRRSHQGDERVLVCPTGLLHEVGYFSGLCLEPTPYLSALFDPRANSFRPRGEVEADPGFKQIIPYLILTCQGQVFSYRRGRSQAEERLRGCYSVGLGGHINQQDEHLFALGPQTYEETLRRELAEEVELASPYRERCVGLINDDSNEVGQVHLGIVHLFELEQPLVAPREAAITRGGFVEPSSLRHHLNRYESWSRICILELFT